MRFPTPAAAVVAVVALAVEARFEQIGVPKVIRPGEPFTAQARVLATAPSTDTMYWGINGFDYAYPGSVANRFQTTDLTEFISGSYYSTIPGVVVPEGTAPGEYALQAAVMGWYHISGQPTLETWWWNVTIGDATSEELVWAGTESETSRTCVPT
ncbi:hypothetical protein LZ30DRAFT_726804 [Colletotrichum cereale]|nr:hypothetical protein LZ30DRAFT_726804 [Colletotrichum cereale]